MQYVEGPRGEPAARRPSMRLSDRAALLRRMGEIVRQHRAELATLISLENGKLVLRLLPNPDLVADLTHWHYDVFEVTWRKPFPWFGKGKKSPGWERALNCQRSSALNL